MPKSKIVVWFSCGAASAVAAKETLDAYRDNPLYEVLIVNNPIANEDRDNLRFLKDCEEWLGQEIVTAKHPKYPSCDVTEVFEDRKYMSGVQGAPCTMLLKKGARKEFEKSNKIAWHVLGFTAEEKTRSDRFKKYERSNMRPILIEKGISKQDCFDVLAEAGIDVPRVYKMGFPNANCIGCVKSQSPTYWNLVRSNFPKVYKDRAEQSRRLGVKLVKIKGERRFLDELKPTDKGGKIRSWDCGIFCETE